MKLDNFNTLIVAIKKKLNTKAIKKRLYYDFAFKAFEKIIVNNTSYYFILNKLPSDDTKKRNFFNGFSNGASVYILNVYGDDKNDVLGKGSSGSVKSAVQLIITYDKKEDKIEVLFSNELAIKIQTRGNAFDLKNEISCMKKLNADVLQSTVSRTKSGYIFFMSKYNVVLDCELSKNITDLKKVFFLYRRQYFHLLKKLKAEEIAHNDIKPPNTFFTHKRFGLLDFGLSQPYNQIETIAPGGTLLFLDPFFLINFVNKNSDTIEYKRAINEDEIPQYFNENRKILYPCLFSDLQGLIVSYIQYALKDYKLNDTSYFNQEIITNYISSPFVRGFEKAIAAYAKPDEAFLQEAQKNIFKTLPVHASNTKLPFNSVAAYWHLQERMKTVGKALDKTDKALSQAFLGKYNAHEENLKKLSALIKTLKDINKKKDEENIARKLDPIFYLMVRETLFKALQALQQEEKHVDNFRQFFSLKSENERLSNENYIKNGEELSADYLFYAADPSSQGKFIFGKYEYEAQEKNRLEENKVFFASRFWNSVISSCISVEEISVEDINEIRLKLLACITARKDCAENELKYFSYSAYMRDEMQQPEQTNIKKCLLEKAENTLLNYHYLLEAIQDENWSLIAHYFFCIPQSEKNLIAIFLIDQQNAKDNRVKENIFEEMEIDWESLLTPIKENLSKADAWYDAEKNDDRKNLYKPFLEQALSLLKNYSGLSEDEQKNQAIYNHFSGKVVVLNQEFTNLSQPQQQNDKKDELVQANEPVVQFPSTDTEGKQKKINKNLDKNSPAQINTVLYPPVKDKAWQLSYLKSANLFIKTALILGFVLFIPPIVLFILLVIFGMLAGSAAFTLALCTLIIAMLVLIPAVFMYEKINDACLAAQDDIAKFISLRHL